MRITQSGRSFAANLRNRQGEIEHAALTRVEAVAEPREPRDPEYMDGLRTAVSAAIAYAIETLERENRAPIPMALLSQARLAARNRVSLETVLRRYLAGYTLLQDFMVEEAERGGIGCRRPLRGMLRSQAAAFDQVIAAVTGEYEREEQRPTSSRTRRVEQVQRLLAGDLALALDLHYEFDGWHLGAIASGVGNVAAVVEGIEGVDAQALVVSPDEETAWVWLGARDREKLPDLLGRSSEVEGIMAVGEPLRGLPGWRLTHWQARAALPVARRAGPSCVRYVDVALTAGVMQDDLLATSLRQIYLAPLAEERDGGAVLRETLRAYFAHDRNASSTAAALGVNRNTVASRLAVIEERLGRPIFECATELEVALTVDRLR
jgi:hypothetical protein